jgi:hypothetical protein
LLCEVLLQAPGGTKTSTTVRFNPSGKRASFEIPFLQKPEIVSFDPWRRILRTKQVNETPTELTSVLRRTRRYVEPGKTEWLRSVRAGSTITELPSSLDGVFLVGSPDTLGAMRALCEQAGFHVLGNQLEYDGTIIDLTKQGAMAVIDLPSGGQCVIGLGTASRPPHLGRSRLAVFDHLGRFLRGKTDPKTKGFLTFKL